MFKISLEHFITPESKDAIKKKQTNKKKKLGSSQGFRKQCEEVPTG